MPKRVIEEQLDSLRKLGQAPPTPETTRTLKKALADRVNLIAAQAARVTAELQLKPLIPDLIAAFDRMLTNGVETDPQCRGKLAIIDALKRLDHSESAVFLRGLQHIQMEPVWGGHEDSAPKLRGTCVLALASCTDLTRREIFHHIIEAFTDKSEPVRVDAARALEQVEGEESALLLRFKARTGDSHTAVLGQVFESLMNLEGDRGLTFVSGFLEDPKIEICEEAALAIGSSRLPRALDVLKDAWAQKRSGPRGAVLLRMIGASGRPEAIDFLLSLVRDGEKRHKDAAIKALEVYQDSPEIAQRIVEAVQKRSKDVQV